MQKKYIVRLSEDERCIERSFQFQLAGRWHKVASVSLQKGQTYFTPSVSIGKTSPYPNVYLAFAQDQQSDVGVGDCQ